MMQARARGWRQIAPDCRYSRRILNTSLRALWRFPLELVKIRTRGGVFLRSFARVWN
jgi:hypothetical protein